MAISSACLKLLPKFTTYSPGQNLVRKPKPIRVNKPKDSKNRLAYKKTKISREVEAGSTNTTIDASENPARMLLKTIKVTCCLGFDDITYYTTV